MMLEWPKISRRTLAIARISFRREGVTRDFLMRLRGSMTPSKETWPNLRTLPAMTQYGPIWGPYGAHMGPSIMAPLREQIWAPMGPNMGPILYIIKEIQVVHMILYCCIVVYTIL
jgi:hypothetical protein